MIRGLLRFLGLWCLAAAVVAATVDGTRTIAGGALALTRFGETWTQLHGASLAAARAAADRAFGPSLWDPAMLVVLSVPTAVVFFVLAALLLLLGRPKRDVFG